MDRALGRGLVHEVIESYKPQRLVRMLPRVKRWRVGWACFALAAAALTLRSSAPKEEDMSCHKMNVDGFSTPSLALRL